MKKVGRWGGKDRRGREKEIFDIEFKGFRSRLLCVMEEGSWLEGAAGDRKTELVSHFVVHPWEVFLYFSIFLSEAVQYWRRLLTYVFNTFLPQLSKQTPILLYLTMIISRLGRPSLYSSTFRQPLQRNFLRRALYSTAENFQRHSPHSLFVLLPCRPSHIQEGSIHIHASCTSSRLARSFFHLHPISMKSGIYFHLPPT